MHLTWPDNPSEKLSSLLEEWHLKKEFDAPAFFWVRSIYPPEDSLGGPVRLLLGGDSGDHVSSVTFSPDGTFVAGEVADGVSVWNAITGKQVLHLMHVSPPIVFSPDGGRFFATSRSGYFSLRNSLTGIELQRIPVDGGRFGSRQAAYSPDGSYFAWYDNGSITFGEERPSKLIVWNIVLEREALHLRADSILPDWKLEEEFDRSEFTSISISPDSKHIALGCADAKVRIIDSTTGKTVGCFEQLTSEPWSVRFSPDGSLIACGCSQGLLLIDALTYSNVVCLGESNEASYVAFSDDGKQILTASPMSPCVNIWHAHNHSKLRRFIKPCQWSNPLFIPNRELIALPTKEKGILVWDPFAAENREYFRYTDASQNCGTLSPDGSLIATADAELQVALRDSRTGLRTITLRNGKRDENYVEYFNCLAFSPDGEVLAAGGIEGLFVWLIQDPSKPLWAVTDFFVCSMAISSEGNRIVASSPGGKIHQWRLHDGMPLCHLDEIPQPSHTDTEPTSSLAISIDGTSIVSCTHDESWVTGSIQSQISMWDSSCGKLLRIVTFPDADLRNVGFSVNGREILTESASGIIRLWDKESFDFLDEVQGRGVVKPVTTEFRFPFRLLLRGLDTVIENSCSGQPVAWFPGTPKDITIYPKGDTWVGNIGNQFALLRLEGG